MQGKQAESQAKKSAHQASKYEHLVSAAGGCMANAGRGGRPLPDDGGDPLHAVSVQDGHVPDQLTCPLPTAPQRLSH